MSTTRWGILPSAWPDVGALINVHHNETIALFASGAAKELRVLSLEFPSRDATRRPAGGDRLA
jgi:hypothetical protein